LLPLFIPLPLFASGWQAVLGSGGWLSLPWWNATRAGVFSPDSGSWTPWGQGIGSAVWIHAVAGVPWVILLAGQGLLAVERGLEEDAWLMLPAWQVVWRVSLRRAGPAIAGAALWVGLQAAGEITVTDVMQVRTFAEEVYTQLVGAEAAAGRGDPLSRAVAMALPWVLLNATLILILAQRWERRLPAAQTDVLPPLTFPLGRWRWPLAVLVMLLGGFLIGVPLGSLVWRVGLTGAPPSWSAEVARAHLGLVWRAEHDLLLGSLALAAGAGVACAALALLACWAALGTRWFRAGVLVLMAAAWALPGPVVGLGLKDTIAALLNRAHWPLLDRLLWHGPSPVPLGWAYVLRFFPCAVAILWPVVRLIPRDLFDAARVDGASAAGELRHVVWPQTAGAFGRAALAVAVLSLGELSAGKLVSTPGMPGYAEWVFTQMHYGVTNDLAARCLLLLLAVLAGAATVAVVQGRRRGV
jgi:iron(III) transport system permease protein